MRASTVIQNSDALRARGLAALFTLLFSHELVFADVTIARVFVTEPITQTIDIGAGRYVAVPLSGGGMGDRYRVEVGLGNQVYRDISARHGPGMQADLSSDGIA